MAEYFTSELQKIRDMTLERGLSIEYSHSRTVDYFHAGTGGTHASTPDIVPHFEITQKIDGPTGSIEIYFECTPVPVKEGIDERAKKLLQEQGIVPLRSDLADIALQTPQVNVSYRSNDRNTACDFTLYEADKKPKNVFTAYYFFEGLKPEEAYAKMLDLLEGKRKPEELQARR